ncbi:MAG: NAD-dependent epimerase/dehydratase family protein [Candidatus Geothermarchaeales archaeon]
MDEHKIGIVGGAGYIGSSLARHLSKAFRVKILDMRTPPSDLEGKVDYEICDVREFQDVEGCLKDVSLVINSAIIQIPLINEERRMGYEVNIVGTQNVCRVVHETPSIRGMILTGSWHVFGERGLRGVIDEEFGFRPDRVEDRARLYTLSKLAQETIVKLHDEMSEKVFGVIRMGTVLGEGMPEKTAANIFMSRGLEGQTLTPYKHSMYRPMLYVDVKDVCRGFESFAKKILGEARGKGDLPHVFNITYPQPITVIELAHMVRDAIVKYSKGALRPEIEVVDTGKPELFTPRDKDAIKIDVSRAVKFLDLGRLTSPRESIEDLIEGRIKQRG